MSYLQTFRQPIEDTNNHAPSFDKETYSYELPMPLPANFSISYFASDITVTDLDLTNTGIIFSIDTEDFTVASAGSLDSLAKTFRPTIISNKALKYTESQTFTLTATVIREYIEIVHDITN